MDMPKSLHEVLGEQQTKSGLLAIALFTIATTTLVLFLLIHQSDMQKLPWWQVMLGVLLVIDIIAGCAANFTRGTNDYYANRNTSRWVFIAIHVHILVVALALEQPFVESAYVWAYTILCAILLNCLFNMRLQKVMAMTVVLIGLVSIAALQLTLWFQIIASLFLVKVCYAFAVDHYREKQGA